MQIFLSHTSRDRTGMRRLRATDTSNKRAKLDTYYRFDEKHEFKIEEVSLRRARFVFRAIETGMETSVIIPVVGSNMATDITLDATTSAPTWTLQPIVERIVTEFGIPESALHVLAAGLSLKITCAASRSVESNPGSGYTLTTSTLPGISPDVPPNDHVVSANAHWAIERTKRKALRVFVWTNLAEKPEQQQALWRALGRIQAMRRPRRR